MVLINFLASGWGRLVRIVVGLALIALGLLSVGGTTGIILAVIGLVPLLAGIFDFCVFAPLFGASLSGRQSAAINKLSLAQTARPAVRRRQS